MKTYKLWLLIFILSSQLLSCAQQKPVPPAAPKPLTPIRVSYSLNDGILINTHIGQILERTNILEKNGLKGEFATYPTINNSVTLAAQEKIDATFLTNGSAMRSIGSTEKQSYDIVSTQGVVCRISYIVKTDSPIKEFSVNALKGKTIGDWSYTAFFTLLSIPGETFDPKDFNITKRFLYGKELEDTLINNKVDVSVTWSPFVEDLVNRKIARVLESPFPATEFTDEGATRKARSMIILSKKFISEHPEAAKRFMISIKEALYFMVTHKELVNGWLAPLFQVDAQTINQASEINAIYKNARDIKDIKLVPSEEDIKGVKGSTYRKNLARKNAWTDPMATHKTDFEPWLNFDLAKEAEKEFSKQSYDPTTVKIINK